MLFVAIDNFEESYIFERHCGRHPTKATKFHLLLNDFNLAVELRIHFGQLKARVSVTGLTDFSAIITRFFFGRKIIGRIFKANLVRLECEHE